MSVFKLYTGVKGFGRDTTIEIVKICRQLEGTIQPRAQVPLVQESILQYFWPSFSYPLSLRFLFCLFLSGRFTKVLL